MGFCTGGRPLAGFCAGNGTSSTKPDVARDVVSVNLK